MNECKKCGRHITSDERGLYKKLFDRYATEFLCKSCLSAYLGCEEGVLDRKIEQFRADGCLLFAEKKDT